MFLFFSIFFSDSVVLMVGVVVLVLSRMFFGALNVSSIMPMNGTAPAM